MELKYILGLGISKLDSPHAIELANGKSVEMDKVIKGGILRLGEMKILYQPSTSCSR